MSKYVLLPDINYKDGTFFLLTEEKIQIGSYDYYNISQLVKPGDLLCEKWSKDLLNKYGEIHELNHEDLFLYYKYMDELLGDRYLRLKIPISILEAKYNISLESYMEEEKYHYIVPCYKCDILLSISMLRKIICIKIPSVSRVLGAIILKFKSSLHNYLISAVCSINRFINEVFYLNGIKNQLIKIGASNIEVLPIKTSGGGVFLKATLSEENQELFIKAHDVIGRIIKENNFCNKNKQEIKTFSIRHYQFSLGNKICVYEYVKGTTLETYLASNKISKDEFDKLECFIYRVISFLQKNDYVYGDIRPDNILVFKSEERIDFKLCDWGWIEDKFNNYKESYLERIYHSKLGDKYRYSKYDISDEAAAFWILYEAHNGFDFNTRTFIAKYLKDYEVLFDE